MEPKTSSGARIRNWPALEEHFSFIHKLGEGSFGAAYLVQEKSSGQRRVMKIMRKEGQLPPDALAQEIEVLKKLDHPNIIRIFGHFEDSRFVYIVMEPAEGGELLDVIRRVHGERKQALTESWCARIFQQCLSAVAYCHTKGVLHKDLKSENILLLNKDVAVSPHAVVIDFGVAEIISPAQFGAAGGKSKHPFGEFRQRGRLQAGTATTMAPEVWMGDFGPKCDVWSLGCVLFRVLSGKRPFMARNISDSSEWIRLHKQGPSWNNLSGVSPRARQICGRMLAFDERLRPMAAQCLRHNWFAQLEATDRAIVLDEVVVEALCEFQKQSDLERAVKLRVASAVNTSKVADLVELFHHCDADASGTVSTDDLVAALQSMGAKNSMAHHVTELIQSSEFAIDYTTFLASTLFTCKGLIEDMLWDEFLKLDKDGSGYLSRRELAEATKSLGSGPHIEAVFTELDTSCDGKISFDEFLTYFTRREKGENTLNENRIEENLPNTLPLHDSDGLSSSPVVKQSLNARSHDLIAAHEGIYEPSASQRDSPDVDMLLNELESMELQRVVDPIETKDVHVLKTHKVSIDVAEALFDHADQDSNGYVSAAEFVRWSSEVVRCLDQNLAWSSDVVCILDLWVADKNRDGRVDRSELHDLLDALVEVIGYKAMRSLAENWCASHCDSIGERIVVGVADNMVGTSCGKTSIDCDASAQIDLLLDEFGL